LLQVLHLDVPISTGPEFLLILHVLIIVFEVAEEVF
jgi:hypothetical protein